MVLLNDPLWSQKRLQAPDGVAVAVSQKSPTDSTGNEDCALVFPTSDGVVLAVADGVGGRPEGGLAARLAIEALLAALQQGTDRGSILDGFEDANRRIQGLGSGAATTMSVAEIAGGSLRSYHAGDSTLVVLGGKGKLKLSTIPHSPVGYGVEAGLIGVEEALHHDDLNLVSNLVGMADMRIELGSGFPLAAKDTVVVGTDGLFDNLHHEEISAIARRGSIDEAAGALRERALDRMLCPEPGAPSKPDDLTFVVYRSRSR